MYNIKRAETKPAIAHSFGLSFQKPMVLIISAAGGPDKKRIPARNPPIVFQPKPGMPNQPKKMKSQGDIASKKPVFPNLSEFMMDI